MTLLNKALAAICFFSTPLLAESLAPFYLIEPIRNDGVLLHFDTAPFRRYQLQVTTNLFVSPPAKVTWVTLYTVPPVPFQNHYIVLDSRTNAPSKCYRIVVSP
jgi:hypothetical protein